MNAVTPKIHIENTNLPMHLDDMLKLLIDEDREQCQLTAATEQTPVDTSKVKLNGPCLEFVLANRPFDLLTDIGLADSPPGASVCIINWMRRFLTCLEQPKLSHKSILQPVQVGFQCGNLFFAVFQSFLAVENFATEKIIIFTEEIFFY